MVGSFLNVVVVDSIGDSGVVVLGEIFEVVFSAEFVIEDKTIVDAFTSFPFMLAVVISLFGSVFAVDFIVTGKLLSDVLIPLFSVFSCCD